MNNRRLTRLLRELVATYTDRKVRAEGMHQFPLRNVKAVVAKVFERFLGVPSVTSTGAETSHELLTTIHSFPNSKQISSLTNPNPYVCLLSSMMIGAFIRTKYS
jgi:hypothetical protein